MAWRAWNDIAGVEIADAVYQQFATTPPYSPSGTAAVENTDFTVDPDGTITFGSPSLTSGWMRFTFADTLGTLAGVPEYPAIPCRLTAVISGASGVLGYDVASRLAASNNDLQTAPSHMYTGLVYDGTDFDIAAGTDGAFAGDPNGITLLLELDVTIAAPEFWTDNVTCFEDSGVLTKPDQFVFVPEVEGQHFIPASFDCYPPPPPPPPIDPPPGGGGGSGSGPPHGDCYYAPVYEYFFLCGGYPPGDPRGSSPCLPSVFLVGYIWVCP